jgi:anti-sigma B factor antagonist
MQSSEFTVERRVENGRHTLMLRGELDLASANRLDATIAQACAQGAREIVLDLSALEFVDSAGLRAVISARLACEGRGLAFQLTNVHGAVERLFELTGVTQKMPIDDGRS